MNDKEMTEGERKAYDLGATRWGLGGMLVVMVLAVAGLYHTYDVWTTRLIDCQGGGEATSVFPTAQAAEPERKDLFALNSPSDACQHGDDVIAWKRDDRFATQLRVWCVERSDGTAGDSVVVWVQAENQRFASRHVINSEFYSRWVLSRDADKQPYVDACGGDGFLGWSRGTSSFGEGGVTRRQDGDRIQITGFYDGNLWCLGDDLYTLQNALEHDDNRPDRRLDIAKDVETKWTL